MKITRGHALFWLVKTKAFPGWATEVMMSKGTQVSSIHGLINSQTKDKFQTEPLNTLSILKSHRKRGESVVEMIRQMAVFPGCADAERRSAYCRRWLRKICEVRKT